MRTCLRCSKTFNPADLDRRADPWDDFCLDCQSLKDTGLWSLAKAMYDTWHNKSSITFGNLLPGEQRYWMAWARRLADTGYA